MCKYILMCLLHEEYTARYKGCSCTYCPTFAATRICQGKRMMCYGCILKYPHCRPMILTCRWPLAMLLGHWESPMLEYIRELEERKSLLNMWPVSLWEEVTVFFFNLLPPRCTEWRNSTKIHSGNIAVKAGVTSTCVNCRVWKDWWHSANKFIPLNHQNVLTTMLLPDNISSIVITVRFKSDCSSKRNRS